MSRHSHASGETGAVRSIMSRRVIVPGILILVFVIGAGLVVLFRGTITTTFTEALSGAGERAETWVRRQVVAIANDHLGVEFDFDRFEVEAVDTYAFAGVRFVAPLETGDAVHIIECDMLRVTLGEFPEFGEPIVIEQVALQRPAVRLVRREAAGLAGWSNLIETEGGGHTPDGGSTRLEDVFDIRRIDIADGLIVYDTGDPETVMRFDGISASLDARPADEGWYEITSSLQHQTISTVRLAGRINISRALLHIEEQTLDMELAESKYEVLPPPLQSVLREHEVTGRMHFEASGEVDIADPMASHVAGELTLDESRAAFGDYVLPIDSSIAKIAFSEETLTIDPLTIDALGGTLQCVVTLPAGPGRADVRLDIDRMRIERALKPAMRDDPKYAGLVRLDALGTVPIDDPLGGADAEGDLDVSEGKLVNLPVFSDLVSVIGGAFGQTGSDTARARLHLSPDVPRRLRLTDFHMVGGAVAIRGEGSVQFDGRLNLRLNGGPLERVQSALGELGDFFGQITDQLMTYHVTGTLSDPTVTPKPLGLGVDGPGD